MAATINKEQLMTLLTNHANGELTEEAIDDNLLNSLIVEEVEVDETEDDEDEVETDETEVDDETDVEVEDAEEEDVSLDEIDVESLSPTEKLLYNAIISERKRSKQREISNIITNANIGVKHKGILERMAKIGVDISEIKKTIDDFKEIEASASRGTSRGIVTSKSKIKRQTSKAKDNTIKPGTKAFGEFLAKLKQGKTGGVK